MVISTVFPEAGGNQAWRGSVAGQTRKHPGPSALGPIHHCVK